MDTSRDIDGAKVEVSEVDSYLERTMTFHQHIENMLIPYSKFGDEKKAIPVQITLYKVFKEVTH